MPRPPRKMTPNTWQHLSSRTVMGRFAFVPSPTLNKRVWGMVGRAAKIHQVDLAAFVLMTNHFHIMVKAAAAKHLSDFMQYLKARLAELERELHGTSGTLWDGRFSNCELISHGAQRAHLAYILAHGKKEGLVSHPRLWPGAQCIAALCEGAPIVGQWFDRPGYVRALAKARRRDETVDRADFMLDVPVELTPIDPFADLDEDARHAAHTAIVDDIVARHVDHAAYPSIDAILAIDPRTIPAKVKRSHCPRADARGPDSEARLRAYDEDRRRGTEAWYAAMDHVVRRGAEGAEFPAGFIVPPVITAALRAASP